jgi:type II secretory pathway pseudopilin PulG
MNRRKGQESGFALLFVLAAAAIIAIMLYAEMPRVAFEGQRLKETDLIAHGEQYKRAIKLFYQKFGRYPPSIEALENTNNMRFLRHRFKDPMTGKDEWRFIHSGGGGGFTDSLTMKPPKIAGTTDASDMASASSGSATSNQPQTLQRWQLQRPGQTPSPDAASGNPDAPADDSQQQGIPGQPGQPGGLQPGDPGYQAGVLQPGQPGYQQMPGGPNQPGMGRRPYQPGGQAYGSPNQPNYPPAGVNLPGMPSGGLGGSQSGGLGADNQGSGSSTSGSTSSGGTFGTMVAGGAGIAGVASKVEAEGIKIYKEHSKYNEWEFIYDPRQELVGLLGPQAQPGGPVVDQTGLSGAPGFSQQPGASPQGTTQSGTQPGTSGH